MRARLWLVAVAALLCPTAAIAATPFELTSVGGKPQVAVDAAGNGHFVWNVGVIGGPDVTQYCKVPSGATQCVINAPFSPAAKDSNNNADFDGPKVFVTGNTVVVMTHRCCGGFPPSGADGVIIFVSTNGGESFGPAEVIGSANISGDAILGPGARFSTISDVVTGGTFYQATTAGAFTRDTANLGDSGPSQSYSGSLGLIDTNTPIATFDDLETTFWRAYLGSGDYNDVTRWTPTTAVGPGDSGRLAYGPSGVWLLFRVGTPGNTTYVARRFTGPGFDPAAVEVSETGDPIFADFFQDSAGRLHAAWLQGDRALVYRRSDDGTTYGPTTQLVGATDRIFNIEVAAGSDGEGWAVWDANSSRAEIRAVALEVALEPPTLGETVNASVVEGEVLIKLPAGSARASGGGGTKGTGFVPLTEARTIPVRSILDTSRGTVRLSSARDKAGKTQAGQFSAGVFQVLQSRKRKEKGLTELRLKGSAAKFSSCPRGKAGAQSAGSRRRKIRRLRGNAKGRYRTRGRHSAATVRGTAWTVTDRCDGTLTTVKRGKVAVRDFRLRKTIVLKRGKRYLARARPS